MKQYAAALSESLQTSDYILLALIVVGLLGGAILLIRRYAKQQKERAIQDLRKQIAQDLHDEMGSQLSVIGLYSELIRNHLNHPTAEVHDYLDKIILGTTGLYQSMKDLVWALQTQQATVSHVLDKVEHRGNALFEPMGSHFRLMANKSDLQQLVLNARQLHHLLFFLQEGMNNAFKHAACQYFFIEIAKEHQQLMIELWDDGKGFDPESIAQGSGLTNMKDRAKKLSGQFYLQSDPGVGTLIRLTMPIG
ncbi:MAG: histidine kinase [Bacteroidota bacterium]